MHGSTYGCFSVTCVPNFPAGASESESLRRGAPGTAVASVARRRDFDARVVHLYATRVRSFAAETLRAYAYGVRSGQAADVCDRGLHDRIIGVYLETIPLRFVLEQAVRYHGAAAILEAFAVSPNAKVDLVLIRRFLEVQAEACWRAVPPESSSAGESGRLDRFARPRPGCPERRPVRLGREPCRGECGARSLGRF